jgi:protein-tyrosine phosphatase
VEKFYDAVSLIVVQCEAGISRSAAIAAALANIYLGDDEPYFRTSMPNMLVYRTILRTYYARVE